MRDCNVVKQQMDYSCGAAALATLMRDFGDDVAEATILRRLLAQMSEGEAKGRKKDGLSLLDLKQAAESMGYEAVGVRLTYDVLPQLTGPILVYLEKDDFRHFSVLRGVREDRVFLADPSRGNVRMRIESFAREWQGIALVLGKRAVGGGALHPLALDRTAPLRPELEAARRALRN